MASDAATGAGARGFRFEPIVRCSDQRSLLIGRPHRMVANFSREEISSFQILQDPHPRRVPDAEEEKKLVSKKIVDHGSAPLLREVRLQIRS